RKRLSQSTRTAVAQNIKNQNQETNALFFLFFLQTQMPDPKPFKQHFESKHPKLSMPPKLIEIQIQIQKTLLIPEGQFSFYNPRIQTNNSHNMIET
uniref:Uncharacterized protein n=1 Tax=Myripristis murdjan TaxID=586833 RepID=A0A667Z3I1_9TELE